MIYYITFIAKILTRQAGLNVLIQFFQNNGMSYIWAAQDFKVDSNNVHKCECDQFKQLWHSRITCDAIDSNNMMYKTFKYSHGKEKYTEIIPEHFKKALFQFRMGTHKLPVNNSKHFNVPRADRHCTNGDKSVMGDAIHFLYECTKLNNLRVKYLFSPDIRREPNVFNFVNIVCRQMIQIQFAIRQSLSCMD